MWSGHAANNDASNAAGSGAINDALMADILKSCLAEIGVACYVDRPESGPIAVRVLPEDEDRAREIVHQVIDAAPPR